MSYPKPLSEKSLKRLYTQAGLSTEACDFLHSFFAVCANLYGAIALRDVWSVYQKLKSGAPRIHRRDLIAFSTIVRREVQPYRVYEIEELYTEEPHNDLDRHIVSNELIGAGYGKMSSFYALMDELGDQALLRTRVFPFIRGTVCIGRGKRPLEFHWEFEIHGKRMRAKTTENLSE